MMRQAPNLEDHWHLRIADILALFYWADSHHRHFPTMSLAAKIGCTFLLAWYSHHKNPHHPLLNKSLIMHAIGDGLIELPLVTNISNKTAILISLPAFYIGHIYGFPQFSQNRLTWQETSHGRKFGLFLFTLGSACITQQIAANAHGLLGTMIPGYAIALG